MLLANSCVREAAKTARVCRIRHAPLAASLYSLFIQNHCAKSGTFGFLKRTPEVLTNLLWEVRFLLGNGEGIEALAKPIFVRGASPFYGSGPAARPRLASKMDSLAWLRWAGAGRACRRGGKPPGDWQSQCACPRSFRIWSFVYIRIKCQRILSFPKALFYSLAALRIK